jgi:hypothetical protein
MNICHPEDLVDPREDNGRLSTPQQMRVRFFEAGFSITAPLLTLTMVESAMVPDRKFHRCPECGERFRAPIPLKLHREERHHG